MSSDYAEAVKERAEGYAAAADMIRSLVTEWKQVWDDREHLLVRVEQLEAALYPMVVVALEADAREDAPDFSCGEHVAGMQALPVCKPCAGTGATNHRHYEDQEIPKAVRCDDCGGWGFLMHAK